MPKKTLPKPDAPPRDEKGRILPGHSLNPTGRKPDSEVRELARKHTAAAINALAKIVMKGKGELARVAAANALLDRGWGKPSQAVELTGKDGGAIEVATARERLREKLDRLAEVAKPAEG